jgi:hypothetical protein
MFNSVKISILFSFYFCSCSLFAQKIDINTYKNKAQGYAILSAQYSNDTYFFSRQNYFLTAVNNIKENCDSAIYFTQIAINYADSAYLVTHDSCEFAKNLMLDAKAYQQKALMRFKQILSINDYNGIHVFSLEAMYAAGNAVTDAYRASLELNWKEIDLPIEKKRDATRLESDEITFTTIKDLYGKRLDEIKKELLLLEVEKNKSTGLQKQEISNVIAQLKAEQKELLLKSKNSDDKLIQVKNDLSEEMLQIVNKDIFTTEKKDFYNSNVPIPTNAEIPKGLVYKVQIGFFKNQLPPNHFDGVFPISSEKIDNNYYKYMAGNFNNYADAKEAKITLTKKGYADAFIVSFIDGVKVPISEALKKEKETK